MKMTNDLLPELMKRIDEGVDSLLLRLASTEQEIISLKNENKQLKNNYAQILEEIKEYINQLEQIKSHYVNSNNNIKQ